MSGRLLIKDVVARSAGSLLPKPEFGKNRTNRAPSRRSKSAPIDSGKKRQTEHSMTEGVYLAILWHFVELVKYGELMAATLAREGESMSKNYRSDVENALADQFVRPRSRSILAFKPPKKTTAEQISLLSEVSGIKNAALLDVLHSHGLSSETVSALSLVPVIETAWADGDVSDEERICILGAARQVGIGFDAYEFLKTWLNERPDDSLFEAWRSFVKELATTLSSDEFDLVREDVLRRATEVAECSGGTMGAYKVSSTERYVLLQLESAFV